MNDAASMPPQDFYFRLHFLCFFPAKIGPTAISFEERSQRAPQALKRTTASVEAGAYRGEVEDMLEYAIRCVNCLLLLFFVRILTRDGLIDSRVVCSQSKMESGRTDYS